MINGKRCLALITTRSGSKRVVNKCFRDMNGLPMVEYVIRQCKKSKYIDSIYHSSSDEEYKNKIQKYGCLTIDRPHQLSGDNIPILPVIKNAIENIDCNDSDYIVHVDFSKPLTKSRTIDMCIEKAEEGYDSVFTVKELSENLLGDSAVCYQMKPEREKKYIYFGAVRVRTKKTIEEAENGTWGTGKRHLDYPIIKKWEIDVNDEIDFIIAEALIKRGY